jgi:hypothetical protein
MTCPARPAGPRKACAASLGPSSAAVPAQCSGRDRDRASRTWSRGPSRGRRPLLNFSSGDPKYGESHKSQAEGAGKPDSTLNSPRRCSSGSTMRAEAIVSIAPGEDEQAGGQAGRQAGSRPVARPHGASSQSRAKVEPTERASRHRPSRQSHHSPFRPIVSGRAGCSTRHFFCHKTAARRIRWM